MTNWTEQQVADYYAARGKRVAASPHVGKARGQHTSGVPNKTEQRFIDEYLQPSKLAGEIEDFKFEAVTLKIAFDTRFTPDFYCQSYNRHAYFVEVKSTRKGTRFSEDDSKVKIKVAAAQFPWWPFYLAHRLDNGAWQLERVKT